MGSRGIAERPRDRRRRGCARIRGRRTASPPETSADRAAPGRDRRRIRTPARCHPVEKHAARSSCGCRAARAADRSRTTSDRTGLDIRTGCRAAPLERRAHRRNRRRRQPHVVFVDVQKVADPERRRVAQRRVRSAQVQQIRVGGAGRLRVVHVAHGPERDPHQEPQPLPFRLQEQLRADVVGNIVRGQVRRGKHQQKRHQRVWFS